MKNTRIAITVLAVFGTFTTAALAADRYVATTGSDAANNCLVMGSPCLTIQHAVGQSLPGDTIHVAAGTYNEQVQIGTTLTLLGAQHGVDARMRSGAESIITNTCGPVQIMADSVVLDGFTIQGATDQSFACFFAGVWTNPGFSGTHGGAQILNNIIQGNIIGIYLNNDGTLQTTVQFNLIQNNNSPGPSSGNGIYSDLGLSNAVIDSNKFVGNSSGSVTVIGPSGPTITISSNQFDTGIGLINTTGASITGNTSMNSPSDATIDLFGGDNIITVTSNVLVSGQRAIRVEDPFGVGANTNISAHANCIEGNTIAGLLEDPGGFSGHRPGSLDATNNWWGSVTGPTIASNPGGTGDTIVDSDGVVSYKPFLTTPPAGCPNMGGPVLAANFGPPGASQVRYASNLNIGDSVVNVTNTGAAVTPTDPGNLCVNTYVFDQSEELLACCACFVTPNGLASYSVKNQLLSNSLTPEIPNSMVIKLLASVGPVATTGTAGGVNACNASSVTLDKLAPGLRAWGTTLHAIPGPPVAYSVTETPFTPDGLSQAELTHLTSFCAFIQANASGFGICKGCGVGGLGTITTR